MNMISAFQKVVFQNYLNFNGRARRAEYWWFALDSFIIGIVLASINEWTVSSGSFLAILLTSILYYGTSLALLLPGLGVAWRRLHDIGKGGTVVLDLSHPYHRLHLAHRAALSTERTTGKPLWP